MATLFAQCDFLVTGGAGFIGSNFVHHWTSAHPDDTVVVLDALTYAGNRSSLESLEKEAGVRFVHGDIGDVALVESVLSSAGITVVVNFAAESHNSLAVLDPSLFFRTNVLGTQGLCEAARRVGVERFHHISTCEVYGDLPLDSEESFTEESPYRPRTPYNASKAGSDHVVRCYGETFGLPVTITNCCNNYGPYQFPEKVIPLFITRALAGEPLPMYKLTENRREWLLVDDHCRAVEAVIERGRVGETYNVGSGFEASIEEVADAVLAAADAPESLKTIVPDRPGHDRRYLLDSSKIRAELGWSAETGFVPGLEATVDWYRAHEAWWRPLLERSPVDEGRWAGRPAPTIVEHLSGVRALVTGANGQVGTEVVAELKKRSEARRRQPIEVVAAGHADLDVTNRDAVMAALLGAEPDVVFHLAAFTAVDACETEHDRAFGVNALGTRNVAEAARLSGAHLAYMSTDYVFDGTLDRPYTEWDEPSPISVYGLSKLAGEREVGDDGLVVRTSWVIGRNGANFAKTVLRLFSQGAPLRFVDDQHGCPTIAHDLAEMLVSLALERRRGIFHVTNQGVTTWFGLARAVVAGAGGDPERVEPISSDELDPPRPARRPANSALDNAALRLTDRKLLPAWEQSTAGLVAELCR